MQFDFISVICIYKQLFHKHFWTFFQLQSVASSSSLSLSLSPCVDLTDCTDVDITSLIRSRVSCERSNSDHPSLGLSCFRADYSSSSTESKLYHGDADVKELTFRRLLQSLSSEAKLDAALMIESRVQFLTHDRDCHSRALSLST